MTGWTEGPDLAVCAECATPFAGMVCPTCREQIVAVEASLALVRPDNTVGPLPERRPDELDAVIFDGPEMDR